MLTGPAALGAALRHALGTAWQITEHDGRMTIRHQAAAISRYHHASKPPAWDTMLTRIEDAFTAHGITRARPLPIRWNRETDFTISAIQALDPYLKHRLGYAYRTGYLPQPVIRFTGARDSTGNLADGFLTAFVNISCVRPISGLDEHAAILDAWITALSRLGMHARHVQITGSTAAWQRREVQGITLHISHAGLPIADLVLLWNADDPSIMVTDLGSGLERLRWAITRGDWPGLIHGPLAGHASPDVLDAIRTATLIAGHGIKPANRGCGDTLRKLARSIPADIARFGLSAAVRNAARYWSLTSAMELGWPQITQIIESETLSASPARHSLTRLYLSGALPGRASWTGRGRTARRARPARVLARAAGRGGWPATRCGFREGLGGKLGCCPWRARSGRPGAACGLGGIEPFGGGAGGGGLGGLLPGGAEVGYGFG